jgi:hypothetical protein
MEVMIASAIFFICVFAILRLVSMNLRNAAALRHIEVDAGMVAAQLFKTNRFSEEVKSDRFPKPYENYSWETVSAERETNGLWEFRITITKEHQRDPVDTMTVLVFSPESSSGPFAGRR